MKNVKVFDVSKRLDLVTTEVLFGKKILNKIFGVKKRRIVKFKRTRN